MPLQTPAPVENSSSALALFSPATRAWFASTFAQPTPAQSRSWPAIARGDHTLLLAPTGSGKTLAAFLWCIDRLGRLGRPRLGRTQTNADSELAGSDDKAPAVRVLYVSPLKALAYDVERNLSAPLAGICAASERLSTPFHRPAISIRTGDTSQKDRRLLQRKPGEILITTPESLYLLLGSASRDALRTVDTVIVDEIHALAPTKRGVHLAISFERLVDLCGREVQRIGLSATQRPLDEIARYLAGDRPVEIIDVSEKPHLDLRIEVPVEEMERPEIESSRSTNNRSFPSLSSPKEELAPPGERGIFSAIHPRLVELIRAHRSTIVFTNSRRLCERMAQRLNEVAGEPLVRAHHGSIARLQREEIEAMLKDGRLRGLVATSSLELGIDMGAVDLVIQIESPGAVSRGLQRVGRAGHHVGGKSIGRMFPKFRGDLLETAVVARRMLDGEVESITVPKNALDVLAQQIVAMCSLDEMPVSRIQEIVGRTYSFRALSPSLLASVLDMLAGRFPTEPGDAFADLRPRIIWDREADTIVARRDARLLAIVNGGTIPDRGLYAVHLGEGGPRIGELDEEMVHESRVGHTFLLGASTWRIVEITRDRVIVAPSPGEPGRMPFWRGEGPGRPVELGRALGAFVRELGEKDETEALGWLEDEYHLDPRSARNLHRYIDAQRRETGTLPTDRAITIERFRDELGDWRVCILSPFGARVHAPWALAIEARLSSLSGISVQTLWSDDGIALRFADTDQVPSSDTLLPAPAQVEELLLAELGRSALFATHFRENAARALLLPRRRPGLRTPLWSQRLRAQNLLAVATQHADFPIVLETYRECLNDVFDVPALVELLSAIARNEVRVVDVETRGPSPFARSLAFAWVAAYLYEGDTPVAERKAQALTLDRSLLRELLGHEELRDLLEPTVLDEVEAELQALDEERKVQSADALHDLLRRIGDLSPQEIAERVHGDAETFVATLAGSNRAVPLSIAGAKRWIAIEDVARYRDALGIAPPPAVPAAYLAEAVASTDEPIADRTDGLLARYAKFHAPFSAAAVAARFGCSVTRLAPSMNRLVASGRILEGAFRPGSGTEREYCDEDVLRILRRRTLFRLRNEVAPVDATVLARFLPRWHGLGTKRGGSPRLREAVAQLEGLALPFSELEQGILPARVGDFEPRMLDELGALGEVVWVGRAALGSDDGRVVLYRRDRIAQLAETPVAPDTLPPIHRAILDHLLTRGASFFMQLSLACGDPRTDEVLGAIWDLVWAGLVTNDGFQSLRALAAPKRSMKARARSHVHEAGGRWSAVASLFSSVAAPNSADAGKANGETQRAHARAVMLLERYGIVSREAAAAEGIAGGFAQVLPVLRAMEETGKVRRGHFVEGLAGAQFAHAGAVDRLRAARQESDPAVVTLSSLDPANPYGALLPWPDGSGHSTGHIEVRPKRVAGARVVLVRGQPVFYLEGGGHKLRFFAAPSVRDENGADQLGTDEELLDAGFVGLRELARKSPHRELRIEKIDGVPALQSEHARRFERNGFRVEPGRLVLRAQD